VKLQKLGGYFCIALVFVYLIIFMVSPILGFKHISVIPDPVEAMNTFENYSIFFRIFMLAVNIFIAIFYVVFAMTLRERMKSKAPNIMNFAVIAASITAVAPFLGSMINDSLMEAIVKSKDVSSFAIVRGIESGVSSASTHGWGWVFLLTGIAAIKAQMLPKILRYLIIIYGIGNVLVFAIKSLGIFNAFLTIIVFIWLGIYLIRNPEPSLE